MEHGIAIVVVVALCTLLTRALPFCILGNKKEMPVTVQYLGKVLPYAIMGMLVIYCLRNIPTGNFQTGAVQLLACAVVVLLHLWKRNTLISIIGGTIFYMILI